jgi:DNA-binding GntR family transcriptional regulator
MTSRIALIETRAEEYILRLSTEIKERSFVGEFASLRQTVATPNEQQRARLALNEPQAHVLRVTRLRYDSKSRPLALEDAVLPLERFPGLNGNIHVTADISELAQRHSLTLGRATEHVSIVPAGNDVATHLGIAAGADVMKLDRVTETTDGVPIEWRVTFARMTN